MLITSREYKLTLQHREFTAEATAVEGFWQELKGLTEMLEIATDGSLVLSEERSIQFLDTPGSSVRSNAASALPEVKAKAPSPIAVCVSAAVSALVPEPQPALVATTV